MTRRLWIIVTAVTLSIAAIGGVAAFAGGGTEDDQDAQPSLGIPAPESDGVDGTVVVDGSGLDVETLPKYDGDPNDLPITDGPIEEPITDGPTEEGVEGVQGLDGGVVSNGMPVPGFEGVVDETVVVPSELGSIDAEVDTP